MMRTIVLGAALAFSFATTSNAAVTPVQAGTNSSFAIKVAEGCGPGFWRGPAGRCHPFAVGRACPPDTILVPRVNGAGRTEVGHDVNGFISHRPDSGVRPFPLPKPQ